MIKSLNMPAITRKPSDADVSRLDRSADFRQAKEFYRAEAVARDYDFHRLGSRKRRRRDAREWRTILDAMQLTEGVRTALDVPCGTGRFTGRLAELGYRVVGGDLSAEMMNVARSKIEPGGTIPGFVQADAECLPFRDRAIDCVISIRFLFHAEATTRLRILREMKRVTRRWLILEYRHRYSVRFLVWHIKRALRLTNESLERVTRTGMEEELRNVGVSVRSVLPVTRVFSDKWIVIGETKDEPRAAADLS
jgi:ubiquinone/menaquinone biosynthesis C-methylase UbiE